MVRTPTDTLIAAMGDVGEATQCLVILTTADGHILTLGSTDQRVIRLGMLESAKQWLVADMTAESLRES
jgi:hypothetical protein